MIEKLLDPILLPFRLIRDKVFQVKQAPMQIKGEISRAQGQINYVKSDFQQYGRDIKEAGQMAGQAKGQAGQFAGQAQQMRGQAQQGMPQQGMPQQGMPQQQGWGQPQGMPQQQGWGQQGGAPQGQMGNQQGFGGGGQPGFAPAGPPARAKMGLFSKKKKCPACGQKLHASWTDCPYCGWSQNAAMGQGQMMAPMPMAGPQRTMALDAAAPMPGGPVSDGLLGWFIPLEGQQMGELFQIKGRMVLGTAPDCHIVVADGSISGHHAEFVPTSNGFRLNDLGSTNGTWVNDKRVQSHDLVDNDNVRLGRLNFKYKSLV